MDIKQRRIFLEDCTNNDIEFRSCCANNYFNATFQDRENFTSEEFHTSAGAREILAIFKAGKKNTPLDRAFDIYLPKDIETGTYELNTPDQLIQVAFTENFPAYATHWAIDGTITLFVNTEHQHYSGNVQMNFKDKQGTLFGSNSDFCFSLAL